MPDYTNVRMYKILKPLDDDVCVGSAVESLSQRMARLRDSMKRKPHFKSYKHTAHVGFENCYIELIEEYQCECKDELRAKEGTCIRRLGTLNARTECRTINGVETTKN